MNEKFETGNLVKFIMPPVPPLLLNYKFQLKQIPYIRRSDNQPDYDFDKINKLTDKEINKLYNPILPSDLLQNIIDNNFEAKRCGVIVDTWQKWYNSEKAIIESFVQ